jgi:hypothetical protein
MKFLLNLFKNNKEVEQIKKEKNTQSSSANKEQIAKRKGEIGEYKIDIQLDQLPKEYKYVSDILVKNSKARSGYSQIDHMVISPYGIFVIETKNYQGTIYGGKTRKTWSVNGKFKMMNPFTQNYGHIQAIKDIVDKRYHDYFISMVSFTKRCTFKIDELDLRKIASNELIVYDVELSDYIHRKVSVLKIHHKEPLLSENEINDIYNALVEANIVDQGIRNKHVQLLKEESLVPKESVNKDNQQQNKCIVCGKHVSEKVIEFCLSSTKFNGKIYCFDHQKLK